MFDMSILYCEKDNKKSRRDEQTRLLTNQLILCDPLENWTEYVHHLTTICVNVRDRVCLWVCLFVRYLLLDRLKYGNMNGTMLSQILRGMF